MLGKCFRLIVILFLHYLLMLHNLLVEICWLQENIWSHAIKNPAHNNVISCVPCREATPDPRLILCCPMPAAQAYPRRDPRRRSCRRDLLRPRELVPDPLHLMITHPRLQHLPRLRRRIRSRGRQQPHLPRSCRTDPMRLGPIRPPFLYISLRHQFFSAP